MRKVLLIATVLFAGGVMFNWFGAKAEELPLGSKIPSITVNDQDGKPVELAAQGKTGYLLVYFYPKADTPGCTKQACSLRDAYAQLLKVPVTIFGVSTDDEKAQKAFQEKYHLPFTLLADKDKKLVEAFGVPTTIGLAKRQAFLFRNGALVWRDLEASTEEQAADVLKAVSEQ
jgi:peroxiredoxin Q/BCP